MNDAPIGVFDSGVGGISVLKKTVEVLPGEKFIYFGDSANAPYGTKTDDEARRLATNVFEYLVKEKGAKAVLVACNTATSVAVRMFREQYPEIPIVGIEPAIKPAVENHRGGRIVVMATSVTLRRKKFSDLMDRYSQESEIIPMPCPGLMDFVEQDKMDSPELTTYLKERFSILGDKPADAIVLGCTHYPFIARQISAVAGGHSVLYDGSLGTARELQRRLAEKNLLSDGQGESSVEFLNSAGEERINLSRMLFYRGICGV